VIANALLASMVDSRASAATWTVRHDGSGDFTSIAAAVTAAATGDVIQVGPGTWPESVMVGKSLTFESSDGPAATVWSGKREHRHLVSDGPQQSTITGFTFLDGVTDDAGGSMYIAHGARVTIQKCSFRDNYAAYQAGAIHARHAGTVVVVDDCIFEANSSLHSAAASTIMSSSTTFKRCTFRDNVSGGFQGGVAANFAEMIVDECVFVANRAPTGAGAVWYFDAWGTTRNCTMVGNQSGLGSIYVDLAYDPWPVVIERNVVAEDISGFGLYTRGYSCTHTCNVYYANQRGATYGTSLHPSEQVADPEFCDPAAGDFHVRDSSPAAPGGNACGALLGALPVGCGEPPQELLRIAAGHATGAPGQPDVLAPIRASRSPVAAGDLSALAGLDLTVDWDASIVMLAEVSLSDATQGWQLATNASSSSVRISMANPTGLDVPTSGIDVLELRFQLVAEAGTTALHLSQSRAFDRDAQPIDHIVEDGSIAVDCTKGDVVPDDEINSADAIKTLQFAVDLDEPTSDEACAADMDSDGSITSGDAVRVLRTAVGLPKVLDLPAGPASPARLELVADPDGFVLLAEGAAALSVQLTFDAAAAEFTGLHDTEGLTVGGSPHPGRIAIGFASLTSRPIRIPVGLRPLAGVVRVEVQAAHAYDSAGAEVPLELGSPAVSVGERGPSAPSITRLLAAQPNPFNPRSQITFHLAQPGDATLRVIDGAGRQVKVFRLRGLAAGDASVVWDGTDDFGSRVASGVYRVLLEAGSGRDHRGITLLK
jgi:hypothetical protein